MTTFAPNSPAFLVLEMYKDGDPVTDIADLTDADVDVVRVDLSPIPSPVTLSAGQFSFEELLPGLGQYILRLDDTVFPLEGQWSVHVYDATNTPTNFDPFGGVVTTENPPATSPTSLALWMLGRNTFGIATGFDATGQVTQMTIFGFETADDARAYANAYDAASGVIANVPASIQNLIQSVQIESYVYNPVNQRFRRYLRTIEEV